MRHEPHATRKARLQLDSVSRLEYQLGLLKTELAKTELDEAKQKLAVALRKMQAAGVKDTPWAAYWRTSLGIETEGSNR
jgi:uncharacterized small protein (DUF1192 family)